MSVHIVRTGEMPEGWAIEWANEKKLTHKNVEDIANLVLRYLRANGFEGSDKHPDFVDMYTIGDEELFHDAMVAARARNKGSEEVKAMMNVAWNYAQKAAKAGR